MQLSGFAKSAWGLLFYTLIVIVGGAFVRLTFSGDGCGDHWPLCNGSALPPLGLAHLERTIEFSHRFLSGIYGLWVLVMVVLAFRLYPKGHWARPSSAFTLLFTIISSLIGMILVRWKLVDVNNSPERAVWLAVHLANTFLLLASVVMMGVSTSGFMNDRRSGKLHLRWRGQGAMGWVMGLGLMSVVFVGMSGAITSLGDQLYPVASTPKALQDAMDATRPFLVQLRVLHPLIAISVGIYLVLMAGLLSHLRPNDLGTRLAKWTVALYGVQIAVGLLNVFLKAPDWMALAHLVIGDVIWIVMVLWIIAVMRLEVPLVERQLASASAVGGSLGTAKAAKAATWKDYVVLTKPKVISLLLFTTVTALFASASGWPGWMPLLAVLVGGYMSAGAANAINMVIDRDIDGTMKRTASRPTVTDQIPSANALVFAFILTVVSFAILWLGANLLAALLSLAGLAFYVVIYTLLLKRRTWQNIVIGGAAGAFPPLVGWAAFSGELPMAAWLLFAIVFVWTPVHFWALALMIKDDYAQAKVPMLPVVRGEHATVVQIAGYGVVTAAVSLLPAVMPMNGRTEIQWLYLAAAIPLNLVLLVRCWELYREINRPRALRLYKFSMIYLAILFLVFAVDRSVRFPLEPTTAMQGSTVVSGLASTTDSVPIRLQ